MADIGKTWHVLSAATTALVGAGEIETRLIAAFTSLQALSTDTPAFDTPVLQQRLEGVIHALTDEAGREDHAREILDLFREASALYYVWWSGAGKSC